MNLKWLLAFVIAMPLTSRGPLACERVAVPPVQPNRELAAFDGVVTDHLAASAIPGLKQPAPGLVVKIKTIVSSRLPMSEVAVFPLTDDVSCEPIPRSREDLERQYPVGGAVAVMGRVLPSLDSGEAERVRVITWPDDLGGVAHVPERLPTPDMGFLDFSAFRATYEPNSYDRWSLDVAWRNTHRSWYEDYEFLRCLIALGESIGPQERERLLANMGHYLRYSDVNARLAREQYRALVTQAMVPRQARKRLVKAFDLSHDAR